MPSKSTPISSLETPPSRMAPVMNQCASNNNRDKGEGGVGPSSRMILSSAGSCEGLKNSRLTVVQKNPTASVPDDLSSRPDNVNLANMSRKSNLLDKANHDSWGRRPSARSNLPVPNIVSPQILTRPHIRIPNRSDEPDLKSAIESFLRERKVNHDRIEHDAYNHYITFTKDLAGKRACRELYDRRREVDPGLYPQYFFIMRAHCSISDRGRQKSNVNRRQALLQRVTHNPPGRSLEASGIQSGATKPHSTMQKPSLFAATEQGNNSLDNQDHESNQRSIVPAMERHSRQSTSNMNFGAPVTPSNLLQKPPSSRGSSSLAPSLHVDESISASSVSALSRTLLSSSTKTQQFHDTISISSGTTPSEMSSGSSMKSQQCRSCHKSSSPAYDPLQKCSTCSRHFHEGCKKPRPDKSNKNPWSCYRCIESKSRVNEHQSLALTPPAQTEAHARLVGAPRGSRESVGKTLSVSATHKRCNVDGETGAAKKPRLSETRYDKNAQSLLTKTKWSERPLLQTIRAIEEMMDPRIPSPRSNRNKENSAINKGSPESFVRTGGETGELTFRAVGILSPKGKGQSNSQTKADILGTPCRISAELTSRPVRTQEALTKTSPTRTRKRVLPWNQDHISIADASQHTLQHTETSPNKRPKLGNHPPGDWSDSQATKSSKISQRSGLHQEITRRLSRQRSEANDVIKLINSPMLEPRQGLSGKLTLSESEPSTSQSLEDSSNTSLEPERENKSSEAQINPPIAEERQQTPPQDPASIERTVTSNITNLQPAVIDEDDTSGLSLPEDTSSPGSDEENAAVSESMPRSTETLSESHNNLNETEEGKSRRRTKDPFAKPAKNPSTTYGLPAILTSKLVSDSDGHSLREPGRYPLATLNAMALVEGPEAGMSAAEVIEWVMARLPSQIPNGTAFATLKSGIAATLSCHKSFIKLPKVQGQKQHYRLDRDEQEEYKALREEALQLEQEWRMSLECAAVSKENITDSEDTPSSHKSHRRRSISEPRLRKPSRRLTSVIIATRLKDDHDETNPTKEGSTSVNNETAIFPRTTEDVVKDMVAFINSSMVYDGLPTKPHQRSQSWKRKKSRPVLATGAEISSLNYESPSPEPSLDISSDQDSDEEASTDDEAWKCVLRQGSMCMRDPKGRFHLIAT